MVFLEVDEVCNCMTISISISLSLSLSHLDNIRGGRVIMGADGSISHQGERRGIPQGTKRGSKRGGADTPLILTLTPAIHLHTDPSWGVYGGGGCGGGGGVCLGPPEHLQV